MLFHFGVGIIHYVRHTSAPYLVLYVYPTADCDPGDISQPLCVFFKAYDQLVRLQDGNMSRMTHRDVSEQWSLDPMCVSSSMKTSRECKFLVHVAMKVSYLPAQTPYTNEWRSQQILRLAHAGDQKQASHIPTSIRGGIHHSTRLPSPLP